MYSTYQSNLLRALAIGVFLVLATVAVAIPILLVPQDIASACEDCFEPDWDTWGGNCCEPTYEPDWNTWGGDCCEPTYEPDWNTWGGECCEPTYEPDWNTWGGECCDPEFDPCCDPDDDYCDYCYDDDDFFDYDNDDDVFCDDYCDDLYFDDYESDTVFYDSSGARYSFSAPSFRSAPSYSAPPIRVANMPAPQYPSRPVHQPPVHVPSQTVRFPSSTNITNIDNSINGSFNDYSINNSFNTAIARSATGGAAVAAVTPGNTVAYVFPTQTYYRAPVTRAIPSYVALSQIPYTGFDYGPVGNAIYWMSLVGFAVAGAYVLLNYNGGVLAFVGSLFSSNSREANEIDEVKLPTFVESSVQIKEIASNTTDTMKFTEKGIVIDRTY